MKRPNAKQQRAKREMKRQQKKAARQQYSSMLNDVMLVRQKTNKTYQRIPIQYDIDSDLREVGAMIKKYNDYVDKGLIPKKSFVDNYEQASWMRNEVLSNGEIESALKQADTWKERTAKRHQQHIQEDLDLFSQFGF